MCLTWVLVLQFQLVAPVPTVHHKHRPLATLTNTKAVKTDSASQAEADKEADKEALARARRECIRQMFEKAKRRQEGSNHGNNTQP